jgi:hypothetical protein
MTAVGPERVIVPFAGDGAGEGPLSWGQAENWWAIVRQGGWLPLGGIRPLDPGTTVEDIAGELAYLMGRYPSMRTRLRFDEVPRPTQVVAVRGEITLEVYDAGERDPDGVAQEVHDRYRDADLDFTVEWPVRMAVVRGPGGLTHQVVLVSHFVTDAAGAMVMMAEVTVLEPAPATGLQPLDQAAWQHSPAGRRHNDAALRYWQGILRAAAPRRFPEPAVRTRPRYWQGEFTSPALRNALRTIVGRTGVDSTTVLLALYAASLARVGGTEPVVIRPMVSNRFRAGLAGVVCTLCQAGLLMVEVGDGPFDDLLERTRRLALSAYKYAYFDPVDMGALRERVGHERGAGIELGCFFNDRRGPDRERALAAAATDPAGAGMRWLSTRDAPAVEPLFVHVDDVPDTVRITIQLDADTLAPADGEALLRGMESIAVEAALREPSAAGG